MSVPAPTTPPTPEPGLADRIREVLNTIGDPCSVASGTPMGIEEMGLIDTVEVEPDGRVRVAMRLTAPLCHNVGYFSVEIKRRLAEVTGVTSIVVSMDHGLDWTPALISQAAQTRRRTTLQSRGFPAR
ncbi:iron-sulfur cluster assembly protein [Frankia sp. AiPs1]|uniref:metal-sulfur cluster assembly factor n=1 Tax=Frankia sp. AiPs1 TaxID=573493 RepID=UPI0020448DBA|nr:iron-sulfur cluster assembly protein [Frankia sp. AiPs1]MCM3921155.1 iron-sulfur cluster assembly protein [Frankia sp. AiPs1]